MDFELNDEQRQLYDSVVEFARDVVEPGAGERDREGRFDHEIWRRMGEAGILGLPIAEEHGGQGAGCVTTAVALEALAYGGVDAGLGLSLGAHYVIAAMPIQLHGTDEQRARYLPGLASGEIIGSFGVSEPGAGSDVSSITTRAVREGDEWVLNGTKMWVTNAPVADFVTVVAVSHPDASPGQSMTAFIVPTDAPGVTVGAELDKMGNRSSPTSEVVLDDVRVPDSQRLGEEGAAMWQVAFEGFDWERVVMLGSAIGGMQRGLEETLRYATEREAFGKPIGRHQVIGHKLADMRIRLETARMYLRYAAWLKDEGRDHVVEASIAKAYVAECAQRNADEAIQIHGGWGYVKEFAVERAWRDAKLTSIGGGTTEIQKMVISRSMLG